jgi:hypothetical protein
MFYLLSPGFRREVPAGRAAEEIRLLTFPVIRMAGTGASLASQLPRFALPRLVSCPRTTPATVATLQAAGVAPLLRRL